MSTLKLRYPQLLVLSGMLVGACAISCQRELPAQPDTQVLGNSISKAQKLPRFIFHSSDNTRFLIRDAGGCSYGYTSTGYCYISTFASGGGIQASNGICVYPTNPSPLQLQRGITGGTLGPVYYIVPSAAHSGGTYTALKLQVKNVTGSISDDYNAGFAYETSTHSWTWHSDAPTTFSITVIPNYALTECQIINPG